MNRIVLLVAACCALACLLGLVIGGSWFIVNWDRIPNVAEGDSYDDWSRGGSAPWPGGGASPTLDGGDIAYSSPRSGRGDIYVWNRATGKSRQLTANDDFEGQPAFSPDGERIAYQRQNLEHGRWRIWIMNADGSQQRPISNPRRGNDSHPQFTAGGKRIRFLRSTWEGGLGQKAEYFELDLATGAESRAAPTAAEQVSDRGDTWEVGATWDGQVWIRGLSDGQRRVIAQGGYYPLLMNHESKVAYTGQYARGLWLIDVDGNNRRQLVNHPGYILMQPRSHSESKVVFIVDTLDGKALEMWEVDTGSKTSQLLTRTD